MLINVHHPPACMDVGMHVHRSLPLVPALSGFEFKIKKYVVLDFLFKICICMIVHII
jgi:hypothetical protein